MNAEDIFRSSIGYEIMLMIKARIRFIFSMYMHISITSRIRSIVDEVLVHCHRGCEFEPCHLAFFIFYFYLFIYLFIYRYNS